jgi:uncharacterized protein YndB with AHSA1/START domain
MSNEPFVIERTFNAAPEKVWKALTNYEDMKQWYFDLPGFKAEQGYEFHFRGGPEDRQYKHICKVTEAIPGKKLSYSWRYEGHTGNSEVSFELFPEGDRTRVKLTHTGLDSFPADQPDLAKKNFEAGWTEIIGNSLRKFLER